MKIPQPGELWKFQNDKTGKYVLALITSLENNIVFYSVLQDEVAVAIPAENPLDWFVNHYKFFGVSSGIL